MSLIKYCKWLVLYLILLSACTKNAQPDKPLSSPQVPLVTTPTLHVIATLISPTINPVAVGTPIVNSIPVTSKIGGKLAFAYDPSGVFEIGFLDLTSGKITQLTTSPAPGDAEPFWSYNGQFLVFNSGRSGSGDLSIYRMKSDGSEQSLVSAVHGTDGNYSPAISPDGSLVINHSNRDGKMKIFVSNIDGSNEKALTDGSSNDITASWSPDGSTIIFSSDRTGNYALYTMKNDGSAVKLLLTVKDSALLRPRYSPDGKSILFGIQLFGSLDYHLAIVNADGSGFHTITHGNGQFSQGTWAGNGYVIYSGRHSDYEKWQLYIMSADGSNVTRITPDNVNFRNPSWTQ